MRRAHHLSANRCREGWARFALPTLRFPALRRALSFIRPLQTFDIELDHPEHRLHGPLRAGGIRTTEIFRQRARYDLPRYAEAILQPATLAGLAAIREQRVPETIDLGLVGAID